MASPRSWCAQALRAGPLAKGLIHCQTRWPPARRPKATTLRPRRAAKWMPPRWRSRQMSWRMQRAAALPLTAHVCPSRDSSPCREPVSLAAHRRCWAHGPAGSTSPRTCPGARRIASGLDDLRRRSPPRRHARRGLVHDQTRRAAQREPPPAHWRREGLPGSAVRHSPASVFRLRAPSSSSLPPRAMSGHRFPGEGRSEALRPEPTTSA